MPTTSLKEPQAGFYSNFVPTQSEAFYAWEDNEFMDCYAGYMSLDECRALVNEVWQYLNLTVPQPNILDGRGCRNARALEDKIHLPRWSRNVTVVIHELCHCITDLFDHDESYDHGPKYAKIYLVVMAKVRGCDYQTLYNNAKAAGLKISRMDPFVKLKKFRAINTDETNPESVCMTVSSPA